MKVLLFLTLLLPIQFAQASSILECRMSDGDHLLSQFQVSIGAGSTILVASSCQGLAFSECHPYSKVGAVTRQFLHFAGQTFPTLHFIGDGLDIEPVTGGFRYSDSAAGLELFFPDADCEQQEQQRLIPALSLNSKPDLCLTIGQTTNGQLVGLKIYDHGDGSATASMQKVSVFHKAIIDVEESGVEIPIQVHQLCSGLYHYSGDGFDLLMRESEPTDAVGDITATFAGAPANGQVFIPNDGPSGFCAF